MGYQSKEKGKRGQMAYFTPGDDPTKPWVMHPISELGTADTFQVTAVALKKLKEDVAKKLEALVGKTFASPGELLMAASKLVSKGELTALKGPLPQAARVPGKYI